jgi:hypothetical protein
MAGEALVAMGRPDAVTSWSDWYAPRLREPVRPGLAIDSGTWRETLGQIQRVGDWVVFFERALAEEPWNAVLERWVAQLAPGVMATHGLLRTAHAVRAMDGGSTPARLHELAEGLAYWAARYQAFGDGHVTGEKLSVTEALKRVQRLPPGASRFGLFKDVVARVEATTDFGGVIDLVSTDVPFDEFISEITRAFVREYLANASHASIAFIHTVTAPSALRLLRPHVSDETARSLMLYMWQSCAAMHAAFSWRETPAVTEARGPVDEADLIEQAVAARDEHAIKFAEACLREYRLTGDGAFVAAIRDVVRRERA